MAPLVGIMLNLLDATNLAEDPENNDLLDVFASMECPDTVHYGFQYLLDYNWVSCCPLIYVIGSSKYLACQSIKNAFECCCF